jgi:phospholipid transport system substrate-binding protein
MRTLGKVLSAWLMTLTVVWAGSPEGTVKMVSDVLIERLIAEHSTIKAKPQRTEEIVKSLALPYFDTDALSRRVLSRHWKTASPVQQKRFTEEFSAYLVRFYAKAFANYNGEKIDINMNVETDNKGIATVKTTIVRRAGSDIPVNYRMQAQTNGNWKIIDVVVEGISLVQSKRDEYNGIVAASGIDKLIDDLAQKNAANASKTEGASEPVTEKTP